MEQEQLDNRKLISVRGVSRKKLLEFVYALEEAFKEGYRLPPQDRLWAKDRPMFKVNLKTAALYKEGYEVPSPSAVSEKKVSVDEIKAGILEEEAKQAAKSEVVPELLATLKELTKKADMLEFAEKNGVVIPEDVKNPKAIQAFIAEELSK